MTKKLIKILLPFIILLFFITSYLSFFGLNTEKFNNKIKNEILKINKKVNIELKSVKFLLNPFNLSINIKTLEPDVFFENRQLKLEYIKTNISLKSFINKEFSIDDLQISTKAIKLNDIILLARSFKNSTELFILDKIIKDGFIVGDINLNFDSNGKIKDDYEISGFIKNVKLAILHKYNIENLNLVFNYKKNQYFLEDINTEFNQIKLTSPSLLIKKKKDLFLISGKILSNENDFNVKLLNNLFKDNFQNLKIENIRFSSNNDFTFNVNKNLKISDFNLKSIINLNNLDYKNDLFKIKNYLPNFDELIKLTNHKILINYNKNQLDINGKGEILIEDKLDTLDYKITKKKEQYFFDTNIDINKNPLILDVLDYKKRKNVNSLISLNGIYKKNKQIKFNLISFKENKNEFLIKNLHLNNKLKIINIDLLDLNYRNNNKIQNQIYLKKNKKNYEIKGKSFDATKLIVKFLNSKDNDKFSSIFNDLTSNIDMKINKTYLDNITFVNNLLGNISFKNNKINDLSLNSNFPNNKKLTLSIKTNKNNEKITTLFSDYPKPLIKQYKFIKGFEEGVLEFYSIKKDNISNSVLKIDNFKVKEVPALAKLLSLASLQGIADLLTGEGIRFTDFDMSFSNKGSLMTIDEIYAIGPAVSIMMEGYIESDKLISLKGTLVPATTINRTIASIPLIGNLLVGKKIGEGIFGVSFKMKGPPKDIKTSVNPIKTLTPRFITRTLEKIKKN